MKIKLTATKFTYRKGKGYARYVKDDVFEIDERNGARLIKAGAAVRVDDDVQEAPVQSDDSDEDSEAPAAEDETATDQEEDAAAGEDESDDGDETAEAPVQESGAPLKGAGIADWRKHAKKHGIDTANLTKQQIIAAVAAAEA